MRSGGLQGGVLPDCHQCKAQQVSASPFCRVKGIRIVIAVGKKVFVVQVPFCCQNIGRICVDKPAGLRVIVAVMQVIQPRLRIQIISAIAEGVQIGNVVRTSKFLSVSVLYGDGIAPAVINICHYTPKRNRSSGYNFWAIVFLKGKVALTCVIYNLFL